MQKGSVQILLLIAALGLMIFLLITSFASFKDKIFGPIYQKPVSKAFSDSTGATFSLSSSETFYTVGDQPQVAVLTRTDTHKANLFSVKINFDPTKLEVLRIDTSNTFIIQWVEIRFDNQTGKISIVGGVPKPGFSTSGSDALMATVVFSSKQSGTTDVSFDTSSAIYRNSDNVNFLVSTSGITLTIQPQATPTPFPLPSPTPSPTPTPTPIPTPTPTPTPTACALTGAAWVSDPNPVNEGAIVTLTVLGSSCLDKQVSFEVREDDGLLGFDSTSSQPAQATFNSEDTASTSWVAEYQPDGFGGINDPPEYYFIVTLLDNTSTITSADPKLEVNKSTTTVYKTGDANRNGSVDLQDLSVLLSYWFDTTNFPDEIDTNNDGLINTFDFSNILIILDQAGVIKLQPG